MGRFFCLLLVGEILLPFHLVLRSLQYQFQMPNLLHPFRKEISRKRRYKFLDLFVFPRKDLGVINRGLFKKTSQIFSSYSKMFCQFFSQNAFYFRKMHRDLPKKVLAAGTFARPIVRAPLQVGLGFAKVLEILLKVVILIERICVSPRKFRTFFLYVYWET